jgi:CubicO group peptidase (beta-lactamase class C family)
MTQLFKPDPPIKAGFGGHANASLRAIACALSALTAVAAAEPWVTQTGLTGSQLSSRIATFATPGYGLALQQISGYEESGAIHYAALWGPRTDTVERLSYRGLTASQFISTNTTVQATGWRLSWINGFSFSGTDYYNAIYRKTSGVPQVLRVGDTLAEHQQAASDLGSSGHYLENLCAFRTGLTVRYGAVWNQATFAPVTDVSYGLTTTELSDQVSSRANTWRIHNVCGYSPLVLAGTDPSRYVVVWRQPAGTTPLVFLASLGKANYFAADTNQTGIGWRPSFLQGWGQGDGVVFNAMWVPNGGLSLTWTNQIDTLVRDAMADKQIPALSLAISRNGRLMFKRAYGLADQEAGEWAGTDHRFRIASVSKAITGVAVLHALAGQGTWSLTSKAFGTGAVFGNDYGTSPYSTREQAISISNLLHHTAGWSGDGKLWWHDEPAWGSGHQEFIDWQLDNGVFVADPGDVGRYSNLGFTIAARVVEKLSGDSYETYTRNEIFAPCGISAILGPLVGERTRAQKKLFEVAYYPDPVNTGDPYQIDPRRMDGSTAWIARPADLLLMCRRVDGDSDFTDILSAATVTALHTRETPGTSSGYNWRTYGCGWYTDDYGNPAYWGHNGSMSGTRAEMICGTDGIAYSWAANAQQGISNAALEAILDAITAAQAWPDIDLFGVHHPAYDAWLDANFPTVERGQRGLDPLLFEPTSDYDDDKLPNAAEYFLGLDPLASDPSPFRTTLVNGVMRIRWLRKSGVVGATIGVDSSINLVNWFGLIGVPITTPSGLIAPVGYQWQQIEVPISSERRFIRFRFEVH